MESAACLVYAAGAADRSADWFAQAERDLEHALDSRRAARHEWACFAAQQSAEEAVKALHLKRGQEAWGHVVAKLLRELPEQIPVPALLVDKVRVLDNFYIPSRYPNGHPQGAPAEHYGELQSNQAIEYAGEILASLTDDRLGDDRQHTEAFFVYGSCVPSVLNRWSVRLLSDVLKVLRHLIRRTPR